MAEDNLLGFLAEKPSRSPEDILEFERRLKDLTADVFLPVRRAIDWGKHDEYWLKGGRGSGKSSFISVEIVRQLYMDTKASALIIRKVASTIRDSVYAQVLWALDALGVLEDWADTVSPMEIVNRKTGQKIMFRGLDEPRKLKSIKPKYGYIKIVWCEEMDELESYEQIHSVLESALRGKGNKGFMLGSYNPPKSKSCWVNEAAMTDSVGRFQHHSSYLDIPAAWISDSFVQRAERMREAEPERWRHVYGGEPIGDGGNVFANIIVRRLTAEEIGYCQTNAHHGLDFGYSNDPSALMSIAYSEMPDGRRILYIFAEWCKAGAGFDALEKAIRKQCGGAQVWCDTEPRTIAELAGRGLKVAAARKGKKSRAFGMQWLEEVTEIVIDPKACPDAVREFSNFEHACDKNGKWRADYQDGNDHTIDGVRYACWEIIFTNKRKKYFSGRGRRA